jgi:hypothetical protein
MVGIDCAERTDKRRNRFLISLIFLLAGWRLWR